VLSLPWAGSSDGSSGPVEIRMVASLDPITGAVVWDKSLAADPLRLALLDDLLLVITRHPTG
jgi:hypothetical protein